MRTLHLIDSYRKVLLGTNNAAPIELSNLTCGAASLIFALSMFTVPGIGQTSQPLPPAPADAPTERIFGIVPAFNVTNAKKAPPLMQRQKFGLAARETYDPFTFVAAGLEAGLGQATNELPTFGQGIQGYGKRFGVAFTDQTSGAFFGTYFYPVLLRQDPRYFRMTEGKPGRRIGYALSRVFITRADAGGSRFNWSKILGTVSSGALSNAYYPPDQRGLGLTVSRVGINLGTSAMFNVLAEFWPDIERKFTRYKSPPGSSPGQSRPRR